MIQYTQAEFLDIIKQYNNTDRSVIKANLKRIMIDYDFKTGDVISLGYSKNNVYCWTTKSSPNIPMLEQALTLAVNFNFDIKEFLKNIWNILHKHVDSMVE